MEDKDKSNQPVSENARLDYYIEQQIAVAFQGKTQDEIAKECGVCDRTIRRWDSDVDVWEKIKSERRKRFAPKLSEVDLAMLREAKGGDVRAAELVYQRFDGWVPKSAQDSTQRISVEDADVKRLIAALDAKEQMNADAKGAGDTGSPQTGTSEAAK